MKNKSKSGKPEIMINLPKFKGMVMGNGKEYVPVRGKKVFVFLGPGKKSGSNILIARCSKYRKILLKGSDLFAMSVTQAERWGYIALKGKV